MDDYFPIIDDSINPCAGCPDYEEPHGCKSNGGCGKHTNADRIRAMSDEELSEFLENPNGKPWYRCVECKWESCEECCLEWLKQEAV